VETPIETLFEKHVFAFETELIGSTLYKNVFKEHKKDWKLYQNESNLHFFEIMKFLVPKIKSFKLTE
jgi:hypothetical protein